MAIIAQPSSPSRQVWEPTLFVSEAHDDSTPGYVRTVTMVGFRSV